MRETFYGKDELILHVLSHCWNKSMTNLKGIYPDLNKKENFTAPYHLVRKDLA